MVIIVGGRATCSICGEEVAGFRDIVTFTEFISDPDHHLMRYSDSAMHRGCFEVWEHREEFLALELKRREKVQWLSDHFSTPADVEKYLRENPNYFD